ncbi:MAG TPA: hypothetical protein VMR50_16090 [Myxococcota bacterium]|nr:hypothetical protein [Myxococcota bacterium]
MLRAAASVSALLLALLFASVTIWVHVHSQDLARPDDGDLVDPLPTEYMADGLSALLRAASLSRAQGNDEELLSRLKDGASDREWTAARMRDYAEAFAELDRAISASSIVLPAPRASVDKLVVDDLIYLQSMPRLSALASRDSLERGARTSALQQAALGLRAGGALGRARRPELMSMLLAVGMQKTSLTAIEPLVQSVSWDRVSERSLARELERERIPADRWRAAIYGEYAQIAGVVTMSATREAEHVDPWPLRLLVSRGFFYQPNRTLSAYATRFRDMATAFSEPCVSGAALFHSPKRPAPREILQGNVIGQILVDVGFGDNLAKFNTRRCHVEARFALIETYAALAAYESENHATPDSLAALVPDYLAVEPVDPFDGQPLRWDRERRELFSVGSDFARSETLGPLSPRDELEPALYAPEP